MKEKTTLPMNPSSKGEETIFAEALRLPPPERAAYIAQSTAGNPELRQEVESLLQSYAAGGFLEQAAAPQLRSTLQISPRVTEKAGDMIGRYKLLEQIGEGGCGVVYMAEQIEPVRRRVALKIIKLGMDTKSVIARFEAERQAVAMMDHPNIAKVFDAGATDTGRPYFVMELVRGVKITDYCDEAKLSTRARLDLFMPVCQAIQHAHQKGIIHRDIKPSNILVSVDDGVPVPKVIDFGIAKATSGQQLTDKTLFTAFAQFIGTPAYMSPEQAMLTNVDIDTRSDIYALGVLLYELLTGKTPFDAQELLAIGLDEMRRTIREQEPPRPSTRLSSLPGQDLSTTAQRRGLHAPKLVSELRGDLDWIVMKALEKDRTRRYETANGLAIDVQRHLNHEPVVACPPSKLYRLQKMVRRNKFGFAAAAAVTAALIFGLATSTWMFFQERAALRRALAAEHAQKELRQEAETARAQAEADAKKAKTEAAKSEQVANFLQDMIKGVEPSVALGRDTTLLREILDRTAERVGKDLKNQPDVEIQMRLTLASIYGALALYKEQEAMARESLRLARSMQPDEKDMAAAASLGKLAGALWRLGNSEEAENTLREELALRRKLSGNKHDLAAVFNNIALMLHARGKLADAETMYREGLIIMRELWGNEHSNVATGIDNLASVLAERGKWADAEVMYREALAMRQRSLGNQHPGVAVSLHNLGLLLAEANRLAEAEDMHRKALASRMKLLGDEHPDVAASLNGLARVLEKRGKLAEAEDMHRKALVLLKKRLGDEHPDVAASLNNLGLVLLQQDKLAEAEDISRQALALRRKLLSNEHPGIATSLNNIAWVLQRRGKLVEAEDMNRQALALRRTLFGDEHPDVAASLQNLAMVLQERGKLTEAETTFQDALTLVRKLLGDGHPYVAATVDGLAITLLEQKKPEQADKLYSQFLQPVATGQISSASFLKNRGKFYARCGRWKDAGADLRRALQLNPDAHLIWHSLAAVLVQQGDVGAYRDHCRQSLERFANTTDPAIAQRISQDCLTVASSPTDLEQVARMADLAAKARTNYAHPYWFEVCKGLAEYRLGNFAVAADWAERGLTGAGTNWSCQVQSQAVLAMAQHELKQTKQATLTYSNAIQRADTNLPKIESGNLGEGWIDWIIARALMREAKALIESASEAETATQ
jgi:tetratricopeptide (TPR) repeat protein